MKDRLLSIGEVAKLKGVGIKSLRYYERIGIFSPAHINPDTGYRYYSMTQMMELDVIITCIELGIPLRDLAGYRTPSGALDLVALLERGRDLARQRMRQAQAILLQSETYLAEIDEQRELQRAVAAGSAQVRRRTEALALAVPLDAPAGSPQNAHATDGTDIAAYVRAMTRIYRLAQEADLVPLYKQGVMRAASDGGTPDNASWEAYVEVRSLDAGTPTLRKAVQADGARLAAIPGGTYARTLVEGAGYGTTFARATRTAAAKPGFVLVSDMWKAEVALESSSFEVLELAD